MTYEEAIENLKNILLATIAQTHNTISLKKLKLQSKPLKSRYRRSHIKTTRTACTRRSIAHLAIEVFSQMTTIVNAGRQLIGR